MRAREAARPALLLALLAVHGQRGAAQDTRPAEDPLDKAAEPIRVGFLVLDGVMPTVDVAGTSLDASAVSDCFDLVGPIEGQSCNTLDLTLPMGSVTRTRRS